VGSTLEQTKPRSCGSPVFGPLHLQMSVGRIPSGGTRRRRPGSLADAHQLGSDLEEALRQRLPEISDVVGLEVNRRTTGFSGPPRVRDPRVSCGCVASSSNVFPGQAIRTVSRTRCSSLHRSFVVRNVRAARPAWWATSAVPYRYFWLLPSAGVVLGLAAASTFGVPVWLGFICAEIPALALEAWWRRARPPSGDTP
jgi:hypothetical protein